MPLARAPSRSAGSQAPGSKQAADASRSPCNAARCCGPRRLCRTFWLSGENERMPLMSIWVSGSRARQSRSGGQLRHTGGTAAAAGGGKQHAAGFARCKVVRILSKRGRSGRWPPGGCPSRNSIIGSDMAGPPTLPCPPTLSMLQPILTERPHARFRGPPALLRAAASSAGLLRRLPATSWMQVGPIDAAAATDRRTACPCCCRCARPAAAAPAGRGGNHSNLRLNRQTCAEALNCMHMRRPALQPIHPAALTEMQPRKVPPASSERVALHSLLPLCKQSAMHFK